MGSTKQLGQGDDEDDVYEPIVITSKQLQKTFVYFTCFAFLYLLLLPTLRKLCIHSFIFVRHGQATVLGSNVLQK